jgi:hypothetical protein
MISVYWKTNFAYLHTKKLGFYRFSNKKHSFICLHKIHADSPIHLGAANIGWGFPWSNAKG